MGTRATDNFGHAIGPPSPHRCEHPATWSGPVIGQSGEFYLHIPKSSLSSFLGARRLCACRRCRTRLLPPPLARCCVWFVCESRKNRRNPYTWKAKTINLRGLGDVLVRVNGLRVRAIRGGRSRVQVNARARRVLHLKQGRADLLIKSWRASVSRSSAFVDHMRRPCARNVGVLGAIPSPRPSEHSSSGTAAPRRLAPVP
jgi:hypothetical protein